MTTTTQERRNELTPVELRAVEPDAMAEGTIGVAGGYAAVFGRRSEELYGFTEMVDPGAFTKTVSEADVLALWQHDERDLMARVKSGTLRLAIDERGLGYDFDIPDITCGRDFKVRCQRGDVRFSSFGFRTIRDTWFEDEDGAVTRTLLEVALIDVSPVARPAYVDTDVALRSLAKATDHPFAEVRSLAQARSLATLLGGETVESTTTATPDEDEGRSATFVPVRRGGEYL